MNKRNLVKPYIPVSKPKPAVTQRPGLEGAMALSKKIGAGLVANLNANVKAKDKEKEKEKEK